MSGKRILWLLLIFLAAWLVACNKPQRPSATPAEEERVATMAAETVAAQFTQAAVDATATAHAATETPPEPTPTGTLEPSLTPSNTQPPPTLTPLPCDRVEFVKDVSYPDNSGVSPGEAFIKTWRIRNAGACTWSPDYALVFTGGDPMGTPAAVAIPGYIEPGQTVDLSVTLTAPITVGTYRGDYKLRNASNVVFGLTASNKPFYVQIKVGAVTGVRYDFLNQAAAAGWESGVGGSPDTTLTFGGADDDVNGVAKIKDAVLLENGTTSTKVLFTYPKRQDNGFVSGLFSSYTVQAGDKFKARVGFLKPGAVCGAGRVKFRLNYIEGGTLKTLKDWVKTCDGTLLTIEADLTSLQGKSVQFMLAVLANGPATDDWAIWSSPRIENP